MNEDRRIVLWFVVLGLLALAISFWIMFFVLPARAQVGFDYALFLRPGETFYLDCVHGVFEIKITNLPVIAGVCQPILPPTPTPVRPSWYQHFLDLDK
jgi:hypothetical protein